MSDDDWDDDLDEDEADDATIACPYCGAAIYDDVERCPHCEQYLSDVDAPRSKPWWLVLGVAVCLYLVYRWTLG